LSNEDLAVIDAAHPRPAQWRRWMQRIKRMLVQ
jgi:hypothetical protein